MKEPILPQLTAGLGEDLGPFLGWLVFPFP